MADNNLALGRHDGPDFFAEDDPLAELARIVGHEDRTARPSAQAAAQRREPEFNLEDELMREFERYDAPRLDPANDIGSAGAAAQVRQPVEVPVMDAPRPTERAEPVFEPAPYQPPAEATPPLQHLPFDLTAGAPAMAIHQRPQFSHADLVAELESSLAPAPQPRYEQPEYVEALAQPAPVETIEPPAPVAAAPVAAEPAARPVEKGYTPGFRMPIANFQRIDAAPREAYRPSPVEPAQVALPVAPVVAAQPVEPARQTPPVETNESIWSSLERELTGEGFEPVENHPAAAPVIETPVEIRSAVAAEPVFAQAPVETVSHERVRTEPAFQATPAPAAEFSPVEEMVYDVDHFSSRKAAPVDVAPQPVAAKPVATDADLIDDDFELALDDLDLDLSEMTLADEKPAAPAPAVSAPEPVTPVYAARQPEPAYRAAPVAAPQPSAYAPAAAYAQPAAPAAIVAAPVAQAVAREQFVPEFDAEQFDPTLIADGEEHVESMVEVDVPELPVDEPVVAPKHDSDFDIDLDAELANLLQAAPVAAPSLVRGSAAAAQNAAQARQPMSRATPTAAVAAPAQQPVAAAPAKTSYDADLDDFERALEEDFRRSLVAPLANGGRIEDEEDQGYAEPAEHRNRRWAIPAAAVGILLVGSLSVYAFMSGGVAGDADSGKPLVIAADKEPVKVAPDNPGGKTVPNQDKAVYERVAGGSSDTPRQETLISSNEEPMDVVQRTLTSDNLPLQGEEEAMTENLDTQDERLLPQQANAAPQGEQPVSVMPRKVRTMVVRPDGTLVEQEVSAPAAPVQQAAAPMQSTVPEKLPAQPALAEPTVAPKTAHVPPAQPAPMSAPAAPAAPAQVVTASAPATASARPVPASRPAEQPVNVVASVSDRGNVQQASAPQQAVSVGAGGYFIQVASLPSQAEAQKSYQSLSSKFGNVIGGRGVDIKSAEIAGKGTFYRVRIPAGSKDEAVQLCERYRSAGGSCLVAR